MKEVLKDIKDYEGLYQVSNLGRVKSLRYGKEKILKARKNNVGYLNVTFYKDGKENIFKVHRLVAQYFIPNPENLPQVNHKDENKLNNNVSNLEWCTAKYNCNYGSHNERVRKAQKCKKVICIETNVTYESTREATRQTGIYKGGISKCCLGRFKTVGGYHWKYVE